MAVVASYAFPQNGPHISADLATSLTQSLLNQPVPLPPDVQHAHNIPLPASEIRSRKENLHVVNDASHASTATFMTACPTMHDHAEIRKVSQPAIDLQAAALDQENHFADISDSSFESSAKLPITGSTSGWSGCHSFNEQVLRATSNAFNSAASAGITGDDHPATSLSATPSAFSTMQAVDAVADPEVSAPLSRDISNTARTSAVPTPTMSDKGAKRTRTFTPASARAIDEEDEPRLGSPRERIGSLGTLGSMGGCDDDEVSIHTGRVASGMESTLLSGHSGVEGLM
jgi:hypothetical protein